MRPIAHPTTRNEHSVLSEGPDYMSEFAPTSGTDWALSLSLSLPPAVPHPRHVHELLSECECKRKHALFPFVFCVVITCVHIHERFLSGPVLLEYHFIGYCLCKRVSSSLSQIGYDESWF